MYDAGMPLLQEHRAVLDWLRRYVDSFRAGRRLPPMMQTKWVHCARVGRLCGDMARELPWPAEDCSLAETAGWVHDVGRFSQWAEYGTYHDGSSINHAQRGYEVLLSNSPVGHGAVPGAAQMLDAVRCHNMLELPADLPESSRPLAGLVRDADKLDIFEVVLSYHEQGRLGQLLPRLSAEAALNPTLVDEITATRRGSYGHARTIADFLLIMGSWVFDINHAPALRRVHHRRVIDRLRLHLPPNRGAHLLLEQAASLVRAATDCPPQPCQHLPTS